MKSVALQYLKSSYRERLIEHLLVGELLKHAWMDGSCALEISRPEVDNQGYDLVAEANDIIRHVQIKASYQGARTSRQNIHTALGGKQSGCVVWVVFDPETLRLGPFLFFGDRAGKPLPDLSGLRVARHNKGDSTGYKAERPDIRVVPRASFRSVDTISELYRLLFDRSRPSR